jgi:hypothetical protein
MILPTDNNIIFIIADNSSEIARILLENLVEPLVILARIKGYKGIDDYVIHLIEHELEPIREGGQGISDLGEYVIEYITKIIDSDLDNNINNKNKNKEKEGGITKMNPPQQINKIFVPLFHLQDDHGFEHIRMIHPILLNQLVL